MKNFIQRLTARVRQSAQSGQGLVEYVLILALISVVAIAIMTLVGGEVVNVFEAVRDALLPAI